MTDAGAGARRSRRTGRRPRDGRAVDPDGVHDRALPRVRAPLRGATSGGRAGGSTRRPAGRRTIPPWRATSTRSTSIPLSRSLLDVGGIVRGLREISPAGGLGLRHRPRPHADRGLRDPGRHPAPSGRAATGRRVHGPRLPLPPARPAGDERRLPDRGEDRRSLDGSPRRHQRAGTTPPPCGIGSCPGAACCSCPGIGVDTELVLARRPGGRGHGARPRRPGPRRRRRRFFSVVGDAGSPEAALRRRGRPRTHAAHRVPPRAPRRRTRAIPRARQPHATRAWPIASTSSGAVPDVRATVAASNGLVLASTREGLPRSTMEALALEVPVVTTDARGNPDTVAPDAGIVVPVGDIEALRGGDGPAPRRPRRGPGDGPAGPAADGRAATTSAILIARHEELYRGRPRGSVAGAGTGRGGGPAGKPP